MIEERTAASIDRTGRALTVGERLDRLQLSSIHWKLLLLIAGGLLVDVYDQNLAGAVLAAMTKSGESTLVWNGYFITATFLGLMVGAAAAGFLSDHYGRRTSFQINLLIFGLASLAASFAPDMMWLIPLRFVMCIGLGAEVVIAGTALIEFIPPAFRGRQAAILSYCNAFGGLFASGIGFLILPHASWHWMFGIAAVGALLVWFARKSMPESPRWLEAQGRFDEAEQVTRSIEGENYRPCQPIGFKRLVEPTHLSFRNLFTRRFIKQTIISIVLNITLQTTVWMVISWAPTFLVRQGLSVSSSLGMATLMSVGAVLGTTFSILTVEKLGRKPVLISACLVAAAAGAYFPYADSLLLSVAAGFVLMAAVYVLIAVAFTLYIHEIFPTEIRQRGAGLGVTCGRFVLAFSPYLIVPLYQSGGAKAVFPIIVVLNIVAPIVLALFGNETKGRSLETVQMAEEEWPQVNEAIRR